MKKEIMPNSIKNVELIARIVGVWDSNFVRLARQLIIYAKSCLIMSDMDDMTKAHFGHELDRIIKEIESEMK